LRNFDTIAPSTAASRSARATPSTASCAASPRGIPVSRSTASASTSTHPVPPSARSRGP